jgi:hypothetical protein
MESIPSSALCLRHSEFLVDDPDRGTQHTMLAGFRLEILPRLGELLIQG